MIVAQPARMVDVEHHASKFDSTALLWTRFQSVPRDIGPWGCLPASAIM